MSSNAEVSTSHCAIQALKTELNFYRQYFWRQQDALRQALTTSLPQAASEDQELDGDGGVSGGTEPPPQEDAIAHLATCMGVSVGQLAAGYDLALLEAKCRQLDEEAATLHTHYQQRIASLEEVIRGKESEAMALRRAARALRMANHAAAREVRRVEGAFSEVMCRFVGPMQLQFLTVCESLWRQRIETEALKYLVERALAVADVQRCTSTGNVDIADGAEGTEVSQSLLGQSLGLRTSNVVSQLLDQCIAPMRTGGANLVHALGAEQMFLEAAREMALCSQQNFTSTVVGEALGGDDGCSPLVGYPERLGFCEPDEVLLHRAMLRHMSTGHDIASQHLLLSNHCAPSKVRTVEAASQTDHVEPSTELAAVAPSSTSLGKTLVDLFFLHNPHHRFAKADVGSGLSADFTTESGHASVALGVVDPSESLKDFLQQRIATTNREGLRALGSPDVLNPLVAANKSLHAQLLDTQRERDKTMQRVRDLEQKLVAAREVAAARHKQAVITAMQSVERSNVDEGGSAGPTSHSVDRPSPQRSPPFRPRSNPSVPSRSAGTSPTGTFRGAGRATGSPTQNDLHRTNGSLQRDDDGRFERIARLSTDPALRQRMVRHMRDVHEGASRFMAQKR